MEILEKVGLSKREAQVYETLLRLGASPVAAVLRSTGFHSQVVYRVLKTLQAKGLVVEGRRGRKTLVRAEDPKKLEEMERQRFTELHQKVLELRKLGKSSQEAIVRTAYGNEAVQDLRMRAVRELTPGSTFYVIGASDHRYYEIMGEKHREFQKMRLGKRIRLKLLAYESSRNVAALSQDAVTKYTEFRYLPVDFPIFSSTNVFNDTVAILIWSPDPIVITIESADVAESYRQYFAALWKIARA